MFAIGSIDGQCNLLFPRRRNSNCFHGSSSALLHSVQIACLPFFPPPICEFLSLPLFHHLLNHFPWFLGKVPGPTRAGFQLSIVFALPGMPALQHDSLLPLIYLFLIMEILIRVRFDFYFFKINIEHGLTYLLAEEKDGSSDREGLSQLGVQTS